MENTTPQVNGDTNISQPDQISTPPQPVDPTSPKRKINLKIVLIAAVVFLFLAGGTSAFYLLNNKTTEQTACSLEAKVCPDGSSVGRTGPNCEFAPCPIISEENQVLDTSDWKSYSSVDGNYSLQYPADYELLENEKNSVDGIKVKLPNTTTLISPHLNGVNSNMQLSIHYENGTALSKEQIAENESIPIPGENYVLGGKQGYIFKNSPTGQYGQSIVYAHSNGINYTITIESHTSFQEIETTVNQILSTFKFTDTTSISPTPDLTANWKTYTGDGFSFKYPDNFKQVDGRLRSPDYKMNTEGIHYLENGIEIQVVEEPTAQSSIESVYENDPLLKKIATSKKSVTIAGKEAIRYEFSYENKQATVTMLIHNGILYKMEMIWPNTQTMQKHISAYDQILSTFRFTN